MQGDVFFEIEVSDGDESWSVYAPSSIERPKDNTVMFVMRHLAGRWEQLLLARHCLVYWPKDVLIPEKLKERHLVVPCHSPRLEYARFFYKNGIKNLPPDEPMVFRNGSCISENSSIGNQVTIMPGAYIGPEVSIGDSVYIGSGVRLVGKVTVGSHVTIRENTVIGADGLAMEREADGKMIPIPQFGGVHIMDEVQLGANVTIARGAIDDTVIGKGSIIDNNCFISHNVKLKENVSIVGETILFGSVAVGKNSFISGNVSVRDGINIGENSLIGMSSVVTKNIADNVVAMGNPANISAENKHLPSYTHER